MKKSFLIALALFLKSALAIACSCPKSLSIQEIINNSRYIFNCTVLERKLVNYNICGNSTVEVPNSQVDSLKNAGCLLSYYRYKVLINSNYKSKVNASCVYVETPIGSSMCEIPFEINKKYIIYLEDEFVDKSYCYLTSCDRIVKSSNKERKILKRQLNF